MKTYEEMARDVLKRRDEELHKMQHPAHDLQPEVVYPASPKKRRRMPKIAIPCAAAVTVAAVGICIWNKIPHRGRYINQLIASDEPLTDQEKLDFIYEAFKSHKYEDQIIPVTFESVYKGGKTEININKAETKDVYPFYEMNSLPPNMPKDEDFISIADDEVNSYYGMEFDRLSTVFEDWKSEHQPFGYYNRDIETSGMVGHSVHGYYTLNSISYTTEGGIEFAVSASFDKFTAAVENAKSSVINGFDAMIYQLPSGGFAVDIDMGATVRIHASGVHKDTLIKIIDAYTKPRAELTKISFEEINILDEMPGFLRENDPFVAKTITEDYYTKDITKEYANDFYGMEFDRLGRLHKDWNEDGKDNLELLFTIGTSSVQNVCEINTLSYGTPSGGHIKVSANKGSIPEPETDPGDGYRNSYINGHYALIYRGGRSGYELGAMIEFSGTVVELSAVEFTEEEFVQLLKDFTSTDNADNEIVIHPKRPLEFATSKNPFFLVCGNLFDPDVFKKYTFEQLNGYDSNPMVDHITIDPEDLVKYTMEELNNYYGIEFDRLTKLHGDWEELHGNLGIYRHKFNNQENETDNMIEWTHNAIHYTLPDSSVLTVEALKERKLPDPETLYSPPPRYSTVNGCKAIIYLDGYDNNTYPNGNSIITAIIEMNGTLIRLKTAGFTEEQFLNVLDEYTK